MKINQIIGLIGTILSIISLLCIKKKKVFIIQLIANSFFCIQYWMLNAIPASFTTIIALLRSIFFINQKRKKEKLVFLVTLALLAGIITFNNTFLSIVPVICSILCLYGAAQNNIKKYKTIYAICSGIWIIYNYKVEAYTIIISNIFEIISSIIGIQRNKKHNI